MDQYQEDTDLATAEPGDKFSMDAVQFGRICEEIRQQPGWRAEADKCADYYDDNQLDAETLAELNAKGMGPLILNLIKPTINVVLGMEAKTRTDWRVIGDDEEWQEVAEAQSQRLHEAERESRADRACSDAYAAAVKSGMGWAEITREADPFKFPYRVRAVHRREIYWDWSAKEPDLSDSRYLVRMRWYDVDHLAAYLPKHAAIIRAAGLGWGAEWLQRAREDVGLMRSHDQELRVSLADWEWRNISRSQVALFEVWYRTYHNGHVIDLPDGRVVLFDAENMAHVAAVAMGQVKPRPAVYSKMRLALYLGPHKLEDIDCGVRKLFPYIPCWGYREDLTGVPYGLIRSMLSPQDDVNVRHRKLGWMLSAKRVFADSDALDTNYNSFSDLAREIARPDAVVITNPQRRNTQGVVVDEHGALSNQQFEVLQAAKSSIQEVAGVFNAQLGRDSSANSGLAINSLVEQGATALAEINDNYRYFRRLVGEALLDLVKEDMAQEQNIKVTVGQGMQAKRIVLNVPAVDPVSGLQYRENDVARARVKVALEDVPSTPAYRSQMQTMLAEAIKSMPPNLQAVLAPYWIESSELPKRLQIADEMRKALGMGGEGQDPEKDQLMQMVQQLQQQIQQLAQAPQMLQAQAKTDESAARVLLLRAQAAKTLNEAEALERAEPLPDDLDAAEQKGEGFVFSRQ